MPDNVKPGHALAVMANRLQVAESELQESLTQTFFKGANRAQFTALLVVANAYGLNPMTRELYAFPAKGGGIVPMVSIDGWLRIINEHPAYAGMDIVYADATQQINGSKTCPEYIEVTIHRSDRPGVKTPIREYLDECYRPTEPWNMMTRRMLRHKAIMQAGRVTMGLHGIFDEDEANDILRKEGKQIVKVGADYEVVDVDPATVTEDGPVDAEMLDSILKLAATKQTPKGGAVTEKTITANLKRQYNYEGPLAEMPASIAEALFAGLSKMEDKPRADAAPASEPTEIVMATPEELKELDDAWTAAVERGADNDDLFDAARAVSGSPDLDKLTQQQATAITNLLNTFEVQGHTEGEGS